MKKTSKKYPTIIIKDDEGTPKFIPVDTQRILDWNGTFHRGMETKDFVYFCNYQESDDNGNVKMYRKESDKEGTLELASNNYFGNQSMLEDIFKGEYTYLSATMKTNVKLHKEATPEEFES